MDARILKQVTETRTVSKKDSMEGLARSLAEVSGRPLTIREARDGLCAVLKKAREGTPQTIGKLEDLTVVISLNDLAAVIRAAKEPTVAEALEAEGFKPYSGRGIIVGERRNREALSYRGAVGRSDKV